MTKTFMSYWKTSISQLNLVAVCWKATASRESSHRHLNVNCWNATAGVSNFNFFLSSLLCNRTSDRLADLSLFEKMSQNERTTNRDISETNWIDPSHSKACAISLLHDRIKTTFPIANYIWWLPFHGFTLTRCQEQRCARWEGREWRLWGIQQRRCHHSSWLHSSSY